MDWANSRVSQSRTEAVPLWLHDVYGHLNDRPSPLLAARKLALCPDLGRGELFLACATGDESAIRGAIAADPACVNETAKNWPCPCGKEILDMPPLVAVTHSGLLKLPDFQERLCCARILLKSGADSNQSWTGSSGYSLSALYGAAGKNHDPQMTKTLLDAGANPNDNESLYHSTESRDATCMRLLLEAGARVEGTNSVHHILDRDEFDGLKLLLAYVKDFKALTSTIPFPGHHATTIRTAETGSAARRRWSTLGCQSISKAITRTKSRNVSPRNQPKPKRLCCSRLTV